METAEISWFVHRMQILTAFRLKIGSLCDRLTTAIACGQKIIPIFKYNLQLRRTRCLRRFLKGSLREVRNLPAEKPRDSPVDPVGLVLVYWRRRTKNRRIQLQPCIGTTQLVRSTGDSKLKQKFSKTVHKQKSPKKWRWMLDFFENSPTNWISRINCVNCSSFLVGVRCRF